MMCQNFKQKMDLGGTSEVFSEKKRNKVVSYITEHTHKQSSSSCRSILNTVVSNNIDTLLTQNCNRNKR